MTTQGDELLQKKLLEFGGKGLFVKELEQALLDGRADIAVHSMKDVPAHFPPGLHLPIICKRDNPYDALLCHHGQTIMELKPNAIVGTASLRRQSQLLALRPDLKIKILRGNIHTRIQKFELKEFDAIILACAGLERMSLQHLITQQIAPEDILPACGQGAIGIECRDHDQRILELISPLHHLPTMRCVSIEREINRQLGGHCHVPIAIFAEFINDHDIHCRAKVLNADGSKSLVSDNIGHDLNLADQCAQSLIQQGAAHLLNEGP
jgi:hydroxymethylbilane synthase